MYFFINAVAIFFLRFDEFVHDEIQRVWEMFEETVEFKTHCQYGKRCVVNQGRAQVRQGSRWMLTGVFVQVSRYQIICQTRQCS